MTGRAPRETRMPSTLISTRTSFLWPLLGSRKNGSIDEKIGLGTSPLVV
jgi:hypothetical protein